jgi:hypothetical protein
MLTHPFITEDDHEARSDGRGDRERAWNSITFLALVRNNSAALEFSASTIEEVAELAAKRVREAYRHGQSGRRVCAGVLAHPRLFGKSRPSIETVARAINPLLPEGLSVSLADGAQYRNEDTLTKTGLWNRQPTYV